MELILWRHAEAEEGIAALADDRRRLTSRGEKQARMMAQWLKKHLPKKVRILVSPTERTRMTAHALALPFDIEPEIGPDADPVDLLAAAGWPGAGDAVLLVGHQPTLGRLAALLLAGEENDWTIKKGGVWWFCSREEGTQAMLRMASSPEWL